MTPPEWHRHGSGEQPGGDSIARLNKADPLQERLQAAMLRKVAA
jgi:hypothetical protein